VKFELDLTDALIQQLREVIDGLPLWARGGRPGYIELVAKLLPQLPLESAADVHRSDSAPPAPTYRETGGGFQMRALTPRAVSMVEAIDRVLARLPGVTECSVCRREHGSEVVHASE